MENLYDKYVNSLNLNSNSDFPYLVLEAYGKKSYPVNKGFGIMHWHEDLQFIYVWNGKIGLRTLENFVEIMEGKGVFINKNVIHLIEADENSRYTSFIFPEYFLEFYFGSPVKSMVKGIVEMESLPFYLFDRGKEWHNNVLKSLRILAEYEKNKTDFYYYEVLVQLVTMWLEIRKNISFSPKKKFF